MPPVDRKNPKRAQSSDSTYSLMEFMGNFPDDDACLDWLWRERFSADGIHADCPKCGRHTAFKTYATKQRRFSKTGTACGHHVSITAGTIFEGSSTSLHLWFYAIYLMASTRCAISAKQLERELGVTYKTAWRMFNKIRSELMSDADDGPLWGDVEVDETSVEGRPRVRASSRSEAAKLRERSRATVVGMVERGGRVRCRVVESRRGPALSRAVKDNVKPTAILITDDWRPYRPLRLDFLDHRVINHSAGSYVDGDIHTNTIEGFFGNLKTSIRGTYKHVSHRWLQSYLDEFVWRYNHRRSRISMFEQLLARAARN